MPWHGEYEYGDDGTTICDVVVSAVSLDDLDVRCEGEHDNLEIKCGSEHYFLHLVGGLLTLRHSSDGDFVWYSWGLNAVDNLKSDGLWLDIPTYWRNKIDLSWRPLSA